MKKVVVSLVGVVVLACIAYSAGNRVFARRTFDGATVSTNIVNSASVDVSMFRPLGNVAVEVRMAGGGDQGGTGTVDYVKLQGSVDESVWHDLATVVNDQAITTATDSAVAFTNLQDAGITPYYRLSTLVKDTETGGDGTGVVVNAWIILH